MRPTLVDPCPDIGDPEGNTNYIEARRREASRDALRRTKKGPIYYSAMDVPVGGMAQDAPDRIRVPHTPPNFAKTRIGVPLLKPGEDVHYATGIHRSSKVCAHFTAVVTLFQRCLQVYNTYHPPNTATKSKPPWAAKDVPEVTEDDMRGYATMDLKSRMSRRGGSAMGNHTVPRGYEGGQTGRSRRSRSSMLNRAGCWRGACARVVPPRATGQFVPSGYMQGMFADTSLTQAWLISCRASNSTPMFCRI